MVEPARHIMTTGDSSLVVEVTADHDLIWRHWGARMADPPAPLAATRHVRELPPRTRVEAPKPAAKEKAEPARKTKEEESLQALLKKLGEEQLSR